MIKQTNKQFILIAVLFIVVVTPFSIAQWVSKPEDNLRIVSDVLHPNNLEAINDGSGGTFVFWEDAKENENKIYFSHFNAEGKISFRADGKRISLAGGRQSDATIKIINDGTVLALWLGVSNDDMKKLFAQKVTSNGNLIWKDTGINLTKTNNDIQQYSAAVIDSTTIISFIAAEPGFLGKFKVGSQKLNHDGSFSNSLTIYKTNNRISSTSVIFDEEQGYFVLWLENVDGTGILKVQHFSLQDSVVNEKPFIISDPEKSVNYYSAQPFGLSIAYVCWHYSEQPEELVHNIITDENEFLWDSNSSLKEKNGYDIVNVKLIADNEKLWLGWVADSSGRQNSKITTLNKNGKSVFSKGKKFVHFYSGELIGITLDTKDGIVAGYSKPVNDSSSYNIYTQRISATGNLEWKDEGVLVLNKIAPLNNNVAMASDLNGGEFFVYVNERDKDNSIYARKIFSTGTFTAQIFGFHAQSLDSLINIEWFSANETDSVYYILEKHIDNDSSTISWQTLDSVSTKKNLENSFYNYIDKPGTEGTIYYKIIQKDFSGNELFSSETRVNHFMKSDHIVVAQNIPNPFVDSTRISFYLPKESEVSVEFFDNKIEQFHKIDKQNFSAGKHDIFFKADSLPAGIYFYKFKSSDFVDVKKMVVAK